METKQYKNDAALLELLKDSETSELFIEKILNSSVEVESGCIEPIMPGDGESPITNITIHGVVKENVRIRKLFFTIKYGRLPWARMVAACGNTRCIFLDFNHVKIVKSTASTVRFPSFKKYASMFDVDDSVNTKRHDLLLRDRKQEYMKYLLTREKIRKPRRSRYYDK